MCKGQGTLAKRQGRGGVGPHVQRRPLLLAQADPSPKKGAKASPKSGAGKKKAVPPLPKIAGKIGSYGAAELHEALLTAFGELSSKLNPKLTTDKAKALLREEAEAIVSTILQRRILIDRNRKPYEEAKKLEDAAKKRRDELKKQVEDWGKNPRKYQKALLDEKDRTAWDAAKKRKAEADKWYEAVTNNPTTHKKAIRNVNSGKHKGKVPPGYRKKGGKWDYDETVKAAKAQSVAAGKKRSDWQASARKNYDAKLKAAKGEHKTAIDKFNAAQKWRTHVWKAKNAAESYAGSKGKNKSITLTDIVAVPGQYKGYKKGPSDKHLTGPRLYKMYPTMSAADQKRNLMRWNTCKAALEYLAKTPKKLKTFNTMVSNLGGKRKRGKSKFKEQRIGGNDFWWDTTVDLNTKLKPAEEKKKPVK